MKNAFKEQNENLSIDHAAYYAWCQADRVWHLLLQKQFGTRAGDKRYELEGKGAAGSALRAAHDAFVAAGKAYTAIKDELKPVQE